MPISPWFGNFFYRTRELSGCALLAVTLSLSVQAQQPSEHTAAAPAEKHISPKEAAKLFALVDELMKFSSEDTGLPIKAPVQRKITTRAEVEKYMRAKMAEDKSAQRMQRDEILLKKFGMLDRDFALGPFLVQLLTEQVEAYYDEKTGTVNLLDWVDADEQKPVMAHELTHALQDQRVHLAKWAEQTPQEVSATASGDAENLRRDEWDTAREAITEGQATAVMTDYMLKPAGKNIVTEPEMVENMIAQMSASSADSPVMARAPLLLTESMLFPYRDGLSFVQDVWMDKGQKAAFAGALDTPPNSSWEVLNPREYAQRHSAPIPFFPNIHPLVDALYTPYDIGQIGQLDLHILNSLLGGEAADRRLTAAWNGGIYWAGQLKSAKSASEKASTASLGILYLSEWKNQASAEGFAKLYAEGLGRKYSNVRLEKNEEKGLESRDIYTTSEGPVVITQRGKLLLVAESFPQALALELSDLLLDAQGVGDTQMAQTGIPPHPLSSGLRHTFAEAGAMKAVVSAARKATR